MASKQSTKAKRSTTKPSTVTPIRKFSDLPDGHPDLKALAKNADAYIEASSVAPKRPKPKRLALTEEQARDLGNQASDLGMMLAAVRRLTWLVDAGCDPDGMDTSAGVEALEAISELGAYKADAITAALGGFGVGGYEKEFDRYAKARGYVRKGAENA